MYPEAFHAGIMGVKSLPYDKEVQWLFSDGKQYIKTGVELNLRCSQKIRFKYTEISTDSWKLIAGARLTAQIQYLVNYSTNVRGFAVDYFSTYGAGLANVFNKDEFHEVSSEVIGGNYVSFSFDGEEFGTSAIVKSEVVSEAFLFCANVYGLPSDRQQRICVSNYQIKNESGIMVADFIPVVKDGVGFMFNRCNRTGGIYGNGLYRNEGTDRFGIGPDVS